MIPVVHISPDICPWLRRSVGRLASPRPSFVRPQERASERANECSLHNCLLNQSGGTRMVEIMARRPPQALVTVVLILTTASSGRSTTKTKFVRLLLLFVLV